MPGCRHGDELEAADTDHLSRPDVVVPAPEGPHRRPRQLVEALGRLGVVQVSVREQRERDAPPRLLDLAKTRAR